MQNTEFTPEALLASLIAKYAYLNDNNAKAQATYDMIMSKQPKNN
jgi:hypothetical protein